MILVSAESAEKRANWILRHAGIWSFQRRRGVALVRACNEQYGRAAGLRDDPHIDATVDPLWLRETTLRSEKISKGVAIASALVLPIAWPLGKLLYTRLARKVEAKTLHAVPIRALVWAGTLLGGICSLLFDPDGMTMTGIAITAFVMAQGSGLFVMAGMYGVMEGWLAIPQSADWWPFPPQRGIQHTTAKPQSRPLRRAERSSQQNNQHKPVSKPLRPDRHDND